MTHQRAYERSDLTWVPCICDTTEIVTQTHDGDGDETGKPVVMDFIASTERLTRTNHIIDFDGLSVKNFKQYGPILFDHDYGTLPVGRSVRVQKDPETRQTKIRVKFDPDDAFAMQLAKKYQTGFMKAVSVGVMVIERRDLTEEDIGKGASKADMDLARFGSRLTKTDLMELSLVSIPANVDAKKIVDQAVKAGTITEDEGQEWIQESVSTKENEGTPTPGEAKKIAEVLLVENTLNKDTQSSDMETLQDIREDIRDATTRLKELVETLSDGAQRTGFNAPLSSHYSEAVLKEGKPSIANLFTQLAEEMKQQRKELGHA